MSFQTLFKEDVIIKRYTAGAGTLNSEFQWVPSPPINISMKGNILPYKATDVIDGNITDPNTFGFESQDIRRVFTDQLTLIVSRKNQQEPDEIDIDGDTFVCWRVYNYLNVPLLTLRHCESVFVRKEVLAAGSVGSGN